MATNLGLDSDLAAIKALPAHSTQWAPKVADLLRRLLHSAANPFGPSAVRDSLADGAGIPVGALMAFAHNSTSSGFIPADGRSLSRTAYPALFKVCGTRFGSANSGVFTIPDLRRRTAIGRSTDFPVGTRSGAETKLLSINELPTHRHGHSSMTISERPDHAHSLGYVYGKNEFPKFDAGQVAVIAPSADLHAVPSGTQGWIIIEGNPYDFPAGRSGTPQPVQSGSDGAHGHSLTDVGTRAFGGGEEFSIIGPSMVMQWQIYSGVV